MAGELRELGLPDLDDTRRVTQADIDRQRRARNRQRLADLGLNKSASLNLIVPADSVGVSKAQELETMVDYLATRGDFDPKELTPDRFGANLSEAEMIDSIREASDTVMLAPSSQKDSAQNWFMKMVLPAVSKLGSGLEAVAGSRVAQSAPVSGALKVFDVSSKWAASSYVSAVGHAIDAIPGVDPEGSFWDFDESVKSAYKARGIDHEEMSFLEKQRQGFTSMVSGETARAQMDAWEGLDTTWGVKFWAEMILDPLNLIPFTLPVKAYKAFRIYKAGKAGKGFYYRDRALRKAEGYELRSVGAAGRRQQARSAKTIRNMLDHPMADLQTAINDEENYLKMARAEGDKAMIKMHEAELKVMRDIEKVKQAQGVAGAPSRSPQRDKFYRALSWVDGLYDEGKTQAQIDAETSFLVPSESPEAMLAIIKKKRGAKAADIVWSLWDHGIEAGETTVTKSADGTSQDIAVVIHRDLSSGNIEKINQFNIDFPNLFVTYNSVGSTNTLSFTVKNVGKTPASLKKLLNSLDTQGDPIRDLWGPDGKRLSDEQIADNARITVDEGGTARETDDLLGDLSGQIDEVAEVVELPSLLGEHTVEAMKRLGIIRETEGKISLSDAAGEGWAGVGSSIPTDLQLDLMRHLRLGGRFGFATQYGAEEAVDVSNPNLLIAGMDVDRWQSSRLNNLVMLYNAIEKLVADEVPEHMIQRAKNYMQFDLPPTKAEALDVVWNKEGNMPVDEAVARYRNIFPDAVQGAEEAAGNAPQFGPGLGRRLGYTKSTRKGKDGVKKESWKWDNKPSDVLSDAKGPNGEDIYIPKGDLKNDADAAIFDFARETGLRPGELGGIILRGEGPGIGSYYRSTEPFGPGSSITETGQLRIFGRISKGPGKGQFDGSYRDRTITPEAIEILTEYMAEGSALIDLERQFGKGGRTGHLGVRSRLLRADDPQTLFLTYMGKSIDTSGWMNNFREVIKYSSREFAGKEFTPGHFRHHFATKMAMSDMNLNTISEYLGHVGIENLIHYVNAAEMLKRGEDVLLDMGELSTGIKEMAESASAGFTHSRPDGPKISSISYGIDGQATVVPIDQGIKAEAASIGLSYDAVLASLEKTAPKNKLGLPKRVALESLLRIARTTKGSYKTTRDGLYDAKNKLEGRMLFLHHGVRIAQEDETVRRVLDGTGDVVLESEERAVYEQYVEVAAASKMVNAYLARAGVLRASRARGMKKDWTPEMKKEFTARKNQEELQALLNARNLWVATRHALADAQNAGGMLTGKNMEAKLAGRGNKRQIIGEVNPADLTVEAAKNEAVSRMELIGNFFYDQAEKKMVYTRAQKIQKASKAAFTDLHIRDLADLLSKGSTGRKNLLVFKTGASDADWILTKFNETDDFTVESVLLHRVTRTSEKGTQFHLAQGTPESHPQNFLTLSPEDWIGWNSMGSVNGGNIKMPLASGTGWSVDKIVRSMMATGSSPADLVLRGQIGDTGMTPVMARNTIQRILNNKQKNIFKVLRDLNLVVRNQDGSWRFADEVTDKWVEAKRAERQSDAPPLEPGGAGGAGDIRPPVDGRPGSAGDDGTLPPSFDPFAALNPGSIPIANGHLYLRPLVPLMDARHDYQSQGLQAKLKGTHRGMVQVPIGWAIGQDTGATEMRQILWAHDAVKTQARMQADMVSNLFANAPDVLGYSQRHGRAFKLKLTPRGMTQDTRLMHPYATGLQGRYAQQTVESTLSRRQRLGAGVPFSSRLPRRLRKRMTMREDPHITGKSRSWLERDITSTAEPSKADLEKMKRTRAQPSGTLERLGEDVWDESNISKMSAVTYEMQRLTTWLETPYDMVDLFYDMTIEQRRIYDWYHELVARLQQMSIDTGFPMEDYIKGSMIDNWVPHRFNGKDPTNIATAIQTVKKMGGLPSSFAPREYGHMRKGENHGLSYLQDPFLALREAIQEVYIFIADKQAYELMEPLGKDMASMNNKGTVGDKLMGMVSARQKGEAADLEVLAKSSTLIAARALYGNDVVAKVVDPNTSASELDDLIATISTQRQMYQDQVDIENRIYMRKGLDNQVLNATELGKLYFEKDTIKEVVDYVANLNPINDTLNRHFGAYSSIVRSMSSTIDFGTPLIHGWPALMLSPTQAVERAERAAIAAGASPGLKTKIKAISGATKQWHKTPWAKATWNMYRSMLPGTPLWESGRHVRAKYWNGPENVAWKNQAMRDGVIFYSNETTEIIGSEALGLIKGMPLVGDVVQRFAEGFNTFIDIVRLETYKAIKPLAQPHEAQELGTTVNKLSGTINFSKAGISQHQRAIEASAVFFAPALRRAVAAIIFKAGGGIVQAGVKGGQLAGRRAGLYKGEITEIGLEKRQALKLLSSALVAMSAFGAAVKFSGNNPEVFNRDSPDFMSVRVGGVRIGWGTPFYAALRGASGILKSLTELDDPGGKDFWDLDDNDLLKWSRASMAPSSALVMDLINGKTFIGDPLRSADGSWERWNIGRYVSRSALPFYVESAWYDFQGFEKFTAIADFAGLRTSPLSDYHKHKVLVNGYLATDRADENINEWRASRLAKNLPITYDEAPALILTSISKRHEDVATIEEELRFNRLGRGDSEDVRRQKYLDLLKENRADQDLKLQGIHRDFVRGLMDARQFKFLVSMNSAERRGGATALADSFPDVITSFEDARGRRMEAKEGYMGDMAYDAFRAEVTGNPRIYDEYGNFIASEYRRAEAVFKRGKASPELWKYIQQRKDSQRDVPESVASLDKAQQYLIPYWELQYSIWGQGSWQADLVDSVYQIKTGAGKEVFRKRHPQLKYLERKLAKSKVAWRKRNPQGDAYLVRFYDLTPVTKQARRDRLTEAEKRMGFGGVLR